MKKKKKASPLARMDSTCSVLCTTKVMRKPEVKGTIVVPRRTRRRGRPLLCQASSISQQTHLSPRCSPLSRLHFPSTIKRRCTEPVVGILLILALFQWPIAPLGLVKCNQPTTGHDLLKCQPASDECDGHAIPDPASRWWCYVPRLGASTQPPSLDIPIWTGQHDLTS